ncbi:MAG: hypothetical protein H8E31_01830 [Planctomycetes bacterium]|nr:hypothetical protein [Planctomycetota bacterium]
MISLLLSTLLLPAPPRQDPPEPPLEEQVDRAIARGVTWLLEQQYPDGSWLSWTDQNFIGGPTALVAYSLLKSGLPKEHRSIELALEFLRLHPPTQTYDAAVRCLLLGSIDPQLYAERIERAADIFFDHHADRFTYTRVMRNQPGGDLSNTQFAIVALAALDELGWRRDDKFWEKMGEFLVKDQKADGSFSYHPGGAPTMTMTLAGYGCLAATHRVLESRKARAKTLEPLRQAMATSEEWLDLNWLGEQEWTGENGLNRWGFYAWYGMERAGAFSGRERIGGHDWYQDGARLLVAKQNRDGTWSDPWGNQPTNTPFGLLTLSRATAKVGTGGAPRTGLWEKRWSNADAGRSDLLITAAGAPDCRAFLAGFHPEVVELYTFEGDAQPRVSRFAWLLDGREIQVFRPDQPEVLARQQAPPRYPVEVPLQGNGTHLLEATAWLAIPGSEDPDDVVQVVSGPLALKVHGLVTEADREQIRQLERSIQVDLDDPSQLAASSEEGGQSNGVARAFDRFQGSRWLAKREDAEPWIRLVPKQAMRVAGVRLLPAMTGPEIAGFDLATRVQVSVNGRKHELRLEPKDTAAGTVLEFKRPVRLRELEVRVLERRPGTDANNAGLVGFREILLLDEAR